MSHTTIDVHPGSNLRALWYVDGAQQRLLANAIGAGPCKCTAFRPGGTVREAVPTTTAALAWLQRESMARTGMNASVRAGGGREDTPDTPDTTSPTNGGLGHER